MAKRSSRLLVLSLLGFLPSIYFFLRIDDRATQGSLLVSAAVSVLAFFVTRRIIPVVGRYTLKAGLFGMDINKKGTEAGEKKIPESLGLAVGLVYLVCIAFFQLLHFNDSRKGLVFRRGSADEWLVEYNASLASICFMLFLGFADDVLDIPWRTKILMPIFASLPLVVAYSGRTEVLIPKPLRPLLSSLQLPEPLAGLIGRANGAATTVNLGFLYYFAIVMIVIFCTNSINILAGVNGLEAGQTFIVTCAVLAFNLQTLVWGSGNPELRDSHLFSAYLMIPLAATTLALLTYNWYPSQYFVGDTFTYFAGMVIAVAGVLGHFTETLLLFLLPQLFNFIYSIPQLFGWVHCPRHRLPVYDPKTGLLGYNPQYNLVNLTLKMFGSCTEEALCIRILVMQGLSCGATFAVRHLLAGWYK